MNDADSALQFATRLALKRHAAEKHTAIIRRAFLVPGETEGSSLDVCYFAVEWSPPDQSHSRISAAVVPLTYGPSGNMITSAKVFFECDPPPFTNCPPYVLEILTPLSCPASQTWRQRCAVRPWQYRLSVSRHDDGTRSISVILANKATSRLIHHEARLESAAFRETYDRLALQYIMSAIDPI